MNRCLRFPHSLTGIATGLALTIPATPSLAQIEVTGGGVTINDVELFVPNTDAITGTDPNGLPLANPTDPRSFIPGRVLDETTLMIETNQGNVPSDAMFRTSTMPEIGSINAPFTDAEFMGGAGLVGAMGTVNGTLSFRSIGPTGATFANIPTTLNFQIDPTSVTAPINSTASTEFRSEGWILSEVGFVSDVNASGVVQRNTPVFLTQYQDNSMGMAMPENQIVLNNFVPATAYAAQREGTLHEIATLDLSFTGGTLETPPGFNLTGVSTDIDSGFLITSTILDNSRIEALPVFDRPIIINLPSPAGNIVQPTLFNGTVQVFPVLPRFTFVGIFIFTNVPSGVWFDPPLADGFEYEMQPRDIPIGVASRVFPGMGGVDQADDAVFTSISGFPTNVDADDTFVVSVEGTVLGEFQPGDTLRFSDFESAIGDHIVDGGVRKFTISGIEPAVDSSDPLAFPLKLDFNTPTASFEMRALEAVADSETVEVAEGTTAE
ncbi:MAG: hypothetical protein AAFX01_11960 [Cyanobacteria bacterium J06638_28]